MKSKIVLLTPATGFELKRLENIFSVHAVIVVARTIDDVRAVDFDSATTLLSVGSGAVIPKDVLSKMKRTAYNLHAASPEFPGRDPHHHAVYRGARSYGATLHVIEPEVDSGAIVGVEKFSVQPDDSPSMLLSRANEAGVALLERVGAALIEEEGLPKLDGVEWGDVKSKRADLVRLSEITPLIDEVEFERRYRSFDSEDYDNLTLRIYGRTFRIDKTRALPPRSNKRFEDFTENAFRTLLEQLKNGGYRFVSYGERSEDQQVIWRHDVDFSIHRAARTAEIEEEEGILATYFINPRCIFYNILEPEIEKLILRIQDLGHRIGLHFDTSFYDITHWTEKNLVEAVVREKSLLELVLQKETLAVSWHNPEESNLFDFGDNKIGGLINAYSARLRQEYTYSSDSNGYWRFRPMADVIAEGHHRLHLLTHPNWWTPEVLSPSDRIDRAILGRARKVKKNYVTLLGKAGRENIFE